MRLDNLRASKSGMAEVTQLDAIMNNKYARNPEKLRAWESASHIKRVPKRAKKPEGGTTPQHRRSSRQADREAPSSRP